MLFFSRKKFHEIEIGTKVIVTKKDPVENHAFEVGDEVRLTESVRGDFVRVIGRYSRTGGDIGQWVLKRNLGIKKKENFLSKIKKRLLFR